VRIADLPVWFTRYLREEGYQEGTVRTKRSWLSMLLRYAGLEPDDEVRALSSVPWGDLVPWMREHEYRLRSVTTARSTLRCLSRALIASGLIERDLAEGVVPPRTPPRPLTTLLAVEDLVALFDHLQAGDENDRRDWVLFELLYATGMRCGEASRLRVSDLDLASRLLFVRRSKFDRERMVPLTERVTEILTEWSAGMADELFVFPGVHGGLTRATMNRRFVASCRRVGIWREGVTVHQLRHACATHLLDGGADIRSVQELLGHASVQTTVAYTRGMTETVKRRYMSYHPRENELYEEVDEACHQGRRYTDDDGQDEREAEDG
jgi:site-specific recombinase XerD